MGFKKVVSLFALSAISCAALAGNHFQQFNPNLYVKINGKYAMKNQVLVATQPGVDTLKFMQKFTGSLKTDGANIVKSEVISSASAPTKIIKIKLQSEQSLESVLQNIAKSPEVKWAQPNYVYNIGVDPREEVPNDPKINMQYHHQLMGNFKAWDISTGSNVLIAVTDDGFDTSHEDLVTRFTAKGYNFCDDNTDVTPDGSGSGEHGTHVAGIAAAELGNGKGGAGTAGNANVLPVKFYSYSCNWTSEVNYKAYKYAADNGAKIISTSYNVDGFVGDQTFIAGLDYAYSKGVLHFNSAGNNYQQDPPRDAFNELILVASTNSNDLKSDFSNYGRKVQISAPGEDIYSTVPGNKYDYMSGTSMATPNAAGSAALVWSAHPSWNADQVAAQLIGTADNIDDKNPQYKNMLGSGRINNYRALTEKLAPPKVTEVLVSSSVASDDGKKRTVSLSVHFDKLLNPSVVNKGEHWEIKSLSDASVIPATLKQTWMTGTMLMEFNLPKMAPGKYQLTLKDSLQDPFGQALDGKGTGSAGSDYVHDFEVK